MEAFGVEPRPSCRQAMGRRRSDTTLGLQLMYTNQTNEGGKAVHAGASSGASTSRQRHRRPGIGRPARSARRARRSGRRLTRPRPGCVRKRQWSPLDEDAAGGGRAERGGLFERAPRTPRPAATEPFFVNVASGSCMTSPWPAVKCPQSRPRHGPGQRRRPNKGSPGVADAVPGLFRLHSPRRGRGRRGGGAGNELTTDYGQSMMEGETPPCLPRAPPHC